MQHNNPKLTLLIMGVIVSIDALINKQCQQFLHAPALLQLEARWRGLHYLVEQNHGGSQHRQQVRILTMTEKSFKDLTYINDFEQSYLFHQLYSVEYDLPGGQPYGLIILIMILLLLVVDWTDALLILMQIGAAVLRQCYVNCCK